MRPRHLAGRRVGTEAPTSVQMTLLDPQPECLYGEGQTRMGDRAGMQILTVALGGLWAASLQAVCDRAIKTALMPIAAERINRS